MAVCRHRRFFWVGIQLEVLNRVLVGLVVLHITQLRSSSITWQWFENTEVNMFVSSNMNLDEVVGPSHNLTRVALGCENFIRSDCAAEAFLETNYRYGAR